MKRYVKYLGIRLGITVLVLGGFYAAIIVVPRLRAGRPVGNPNETNLRSRATEVLAILSSLERPRDNQPADAYEFTGLLSLLKKQPEVFKELNTDNISAEDQNVLQSTRKSLEVLIQDLAMADKYNKILAYYPESDLYGQNMSQDITLQRTDEAARNLRALLDDMDGSISAQPLQRLVTCLDTVKSRYQKDACIPEYAALRASAIQDITNQFGSDATKQLKEQLNTLSH